VQISEYPSSAIGYRTPNEVYYQADNNLDTKGVKPLPLVS